MLVTLCIFDEEVQSAALEEINYTLFTSENPVEGEPSKYCTLSISSKPTPSYGIVVIKQMDGKFIDIPVFIDKTGMIRSLDGANDAMIGMDGGYGEKFEVLLAALKTEKDCKPIAKCTIIPFPLIVQDDKGHKIELEAVSSDGEHFLITVSGFKPNEAITMKSRSCHESGMFPLNTDIQGKISFGYNPAVKRKAEGPFEVTFFGENMKPLKIQHYWGKVAFSKPNKYQALKNKLRFPEE